jgi:arginase
MRIELVTVPYRYDERGEGLGAGPDALLAAGLIDALRAAGVDLCGPQEAHLDPSLREEGRTAVNIGHLGADTARLVAATRKSSAGALVVAGDDTAAIGVVAGLQQADGAEAAIGVVWIDAHGDFNTPETSFSGILAGMPVAILAGLAGPLWREAAGLTTPIPPDRIVLVGTRDLDDKERDLIGSTDARNVSTGELRGDDRLGGVIAWLAHKCHELYLHVDLDVLDPRFVPSASTPAANGLTVEELVSTMAVVLATGKVTAISVASLNPGAASRGQRSVASAMRTLTGALPAWTAVPEPPRPEDPR